MNMLHGRKHQTGFSLIELLVTLTIAAILAVVGIPGMSYLIDNTQLKTGSQELYASLSLARNEAVKRNENVTIAPQSGDWSNGWVITAGGVTIRDQAAPENITFSGPNSISYEENGRTLSATTYSFSITKPDSRAKKRCLTVGLNGHVNILTDNDGDGDCNNG